MIAKLQAFVHWVTLRGMYDRLGGRSFLVVAFFSVTGFWLQTHGKLDANYAALATALTGFHIWRARGEDPG